MSRHKRKNVKDNRLDWRDPNMKVLRMARFSPEDEFDLHPLDPESVRRFYEIKLERDTDGMPTWNEDETYDLKPKKNNFKIIEIPS